MSKRIPVSSPSAARLLVPRSWWLLIGIACIFPPSAISQAPASPAATIEQGAEHLRHRTPVPYPQTAIQKRVQARVSLIAAVDEQGNVYDAQAISGPAELRAAALESVLKWHYSKSSTSSGRVPVTIHFRLPGDSPPPSDPALKPNYDKALGVLLQIDATALAESERETLLSRLPVRVGDTITPRVTGHTNEVVKEFNEHLRATLRGGKPESDEQKNLTLLISYISQTVNADGESTPRRIRVGSGAMAGRLISSIPPEYPQEARDKGVQGTVLLQVILAIDGTVKELKALQGPLELIPAALEAVKQWRYQLTSLNGEPVEVESEVSVLFSLGESNPAK